MSTRPAFTLIELLTVIAIVGILFSLILGGVSQIRKVADSTTATSQMRQIGTAVMTYASDNKSFLPGPLRPDQGAVYDPTKPEELATRLGHYLGVTNRNERALLSVFLAPAVVESLPDVAPENIRSFLMNAPPSPSSGGNGPLNPWGAVPPKGSQRAEKTPVTLARLPEGLWGFIEADQENPLVAGRPWANNAAPYPVHGEKRLTWFFDGSVRGVLPDELVPDGPPPP